MTTPEVGVAVYNAVYGGSPLVLTRSSARTWTDKHNAPGFWSLTLGNDDADLPHIRTDDVVQFRLDGAPVWTGIVERRDVVRVSQQEEAGQVTTLAGRGTLAIWDRMVVYPDLGVGRALFGDVRYFNFASPDYDDSTWDPVLAAGTTSTVGAPDGWADFDAERIWVVEAPGQTAENGDVWVRKAFNLAGAGQFRLMWTGDDGHELWLDGVRLGINERPFAYLKHTSVDLYLDAGDHTLAMRGTNGGNPYASGPGNVAWLLMAMHELNSDLTPGAVVLHSDDTWVGVGYLDAPPGFTPGRVMEVLRTEATARGVILPTLGFDADEDSDGDAWAESPDIAFKVGAKGVAVLAELGEVYADFAMHTTQLTLRAWVHGRRAAYRLA